MSTNLRFIVSHGGDFVHVDDEWKWRGNKTTSLLVPSDITIAGLMVRLMEKFRIHPSTQIELKFKLPNMNVPPAEIRDDADLNWYISIHEKTALCVILCETEVSKGLHTVRDTEIKDLTFVTKEDIEQIHLEAQHQWLRPAEICEILRNYKKFILSPEPPNRPPSGSLFLFDRNVLRHFRKDGHNWRKKDGKTVKEANEKLKVGGIDALHCYYAHGEEDQNLKRRIYWMLEEGSSHIVLVHYLEVKENRTNFNRIRESEVIPDSQKPRENILNSEVDSSVFSEFQPYNCEGTLQVTHASEFENAESVYCQQQSPRFQSFDNVPQPMVKKMRDGSIPYCDVPVSDNYQGQFSGTTGQSFESITQREKNKNFMVQSWENVDSNTDGFQAINFQPPLSSAQSSIGMMLGHENELLGHVVSGAIGTRQEFGSHSNGLEEWRRSMDQKLHENSRHDPYSKVHNVNNEELCDTMGPCNTYPSNQNKRPMRSDHQKQDGLGGLPREGLKMLDSVDHLMSKELGDVTRVPNATWFSDILEDTWI